MSKITPGPWRLDVRTGMVAVYAGEKRNCLQDGGEFIFVRSWPRCKNEHGEAGFVVNEQDIADARAIAEVPELIEVIEEMIRLVGDDRPEACMKLGREMLDKLEEPDQVECAKCEASYDEDDTREFHGETYCIHCLGH